MASLCVEVKHHSIRLQSGIAISFSSTNHSIFKNQTDLKKRFCCCFCFFLQTPISALNPRAHNIKQLIADTVFFFFVFFPPASNLIFYSGNIVETSGDCQVGPRFPVLALFTDHNVFHPPPSLHLHLFIHPAVLTYPLTPLPLTCFLMYELSNTCQ